MTRMASRRHVDPSDGRLVIRRRSVRALEPATEPAGAAIDRAELAAGAEGDAACIQRLHGLEPGTYRVRVRRVHII